MAPRETMTVKERWLAAIDLQPVDRLPFWPKFDAAYPRVQPPPFRDMKGPALHDWVGSDRHDWLPPVFTEVRRRTSVTAEREADLCTTLYEAPCGRTELVQQFDPGSQAWHPVRFPVRSLGDIDVLTACYEDAVLEPDPKRVAAATELARQIGPSALTATSIGTSPLMHWVEQLAGVENAHLFLADSSDRVERLFAAMQRDLAARTRLMAELSPADVLYFMENTSTTLISPDQYRAYCFPQLSECAALARQAGRRLVLHMCGHIKAVLPDLARLPVQAFEAFTTPTVGNTTLLDGRSACPDKALIGGTNAALWTRAEGEIISDIERELASLPHHRGLVITSAGVMPPACPMETIRNVCRWVHAYRARM